MFCKNCGNKLTEGQVFCTNCGAKQEPVENNNVVAGNTPEPTITSSTPVVETNSVNNGGMDNNPNSNVNMPNVNNMSEGNGMNNQNQMTNNMNNNNGMNGQSQMGNAINNNNGMNNQNQMGNNMNMNPNVNNNMNNNPSGNNNGNQGKNSTIKLIAMVAGIVLAVFLITTAVQVVKDMKNAPDSKKETKTETKKESEVGQAENQKVYSGFKFTIPEGYTANISSNGEFILTQGDITYTIIVDNSTYEANYQAIITANPQLKDDLEGTINNRRVSAGYLANGTVVVFTAASETQTFFAIIENKSGDVTVAHARALIDILIKAKKDESTFSEGVESKSDMKDKISGNGSNTLENFKFE